MNQRHTEFFGPDLARGPFAGGRMDTTAIQVATALAQLRAPLSRSDSDILSHGDFIRQLADRIAPDYATTLKAEVGAEVSNAIATTFRTELDAYSLIECWLADEVGGGLTSVSPASITFNAGTIIQTVAASRHFRVLTTAAGVATVSVVYAGVYDWHWAVCRHGRVTYSTALQFA